MLRALNQKMRWAPPHLHHITYLGPPIKKNKKRNAGTQIEKYRIQSKRYKTNMFFVNAYFVKYCAYKKKCAIPTWAVPVRAPDPSPTILFIFGGTQTQDRTTPPEVGTFSVFWDRA